MPIHTYTVVLMLFLRTVASFLKVVFTPKPYTRLHPTLHLLLHFASENTKDMLQGVSIRKVIGLSKK